MKKYFFNIAVLLLFTGSVAAQDTNPNVSAKKETTINGKPYSQYKAEVGSSRVDLQACKLEYSIVSPK